METIKKKKSRILQFITKKQKILSKSRFNLILYCKQGTQIAFLFVFLSLLFLSLPFSVRGAPFNLTVSPRCTSDQAYVDLNWNSISGTPTYYILRKIGEGDFVQIASTLSTSYSDPVDSDKNYTYKIKAVVGVATYYSDEEFVAATYCPPVLSVSPGCTGSQAFANLNWISGISGNPTFYILRKIQNQAGFTQIAETLTTSYQDKLIDSDKNYVYQIKAKKGASEYFSNQVLALAQYCPSTLSPPISSCRDDGPRLVLNWSPVSGSLSTYEIYRDSLKIGQTTNTTYDDGPNIEGTRNYNYFIKAIWQDGTAKNSETVGVLAPACPPTLTLSSDCLTGAPGGPKINLSWNSLLGVQNYQIYRKAQAETIFSLLKTLTETNYNDNLVESLSTYSQGGQIFYYVKAIWSTDQKNSAIQQIDIPRCPPYLNVESVCNTSALLNPEMRLFWTATLGATHYNLYRDNIFRAQLTTRNYIDYLDPATDCPGKICTHTYKVDAIVSGLPSFTSNSVTKDIDCSTAQPPSPAPTLVEPAAFCVSGDSRISLSWTASDNVVYYTLYRNEVGIINLLNTSYEDTGVEAGYTYIYRVTAFGKGGTFTNSENSKTIAAVDCTRPSATVLSLSRGCETGKPYISLSWSETTNALKYEIYRGTSPTTLTLKTIFEKGSPEFVSRTWKDTNVSGSTTYYYQVVAVGPTGALSSPSNTPSITTYSCLPTTPTLTLSTVCELGSGGVNLSWTAADINTTHHYEIFREDYSLTTPIKYEYDLSKTSWKDTSVSQQTTYKYKAEAVGYGESPPRASSGYKSITTYNCSPPGPFTLSDSTAYCQGSYPRADLSWTASTNSTSYDLNRLLANPTTFSGLTSTSFTDWGFGKALSFNVASYVGSYVNLGNPTIPLTGNLTIEFWANPSYITYARQNPICKAYWAEFCLTMETSGSLSYYHGNGSSYMSFNTPNVFTGNNKWVHVVITRDVSTRTMRSYKNGAFLNSTTWASAYNPVSRSDLLRIGAGYVYNFRGIIDEVRIYNRVLNDTEVQQRYQGIYSNESNLIGLWHFDEGSGLTASDSSNYGNNGTLVNGPLWIQNGLQSQTNYSWQAKANGPPGVSSTLSNLTNPVTMPLCLPTKPGLVLSTFCVSGNGAVTLRWSYTINTTKYEIYRQGVGLIKTINQGDTEFSSRTWTDSSLSQETSYTYYIKAIGPTGLTNQSDSISITTPNCALPTKPENLTAIPACGGTGNSYPRVNLSWDASANATSYTIYRTPTGSPFPVSTTLTSYTDTAVTVNTTYSYYVIAYGPGGASPASNSVGVAILYCTPSTPSITFLTTGCESLAPFNNISWSDPTTFNTNSYKIYRNTSNSPPATHIITITSAMPEFSTRSWKDNLSLSPLTSYYYWIKAVGPVGESPLSSSKSIATYSCGITPSTSTLNYNLFCEDNLPYVSTSWTSSVNAYSYNLYRENITDSTQSVYSTVRSPKIDEGARGLKFDGADDYIDIPSTISTYGGVTAEAWVKSDGFSDYYETIYLLGYQSYSEGFHWLYIYSSGIYWQFTTGSSIPWAYPVGATSLSWNPGQWYHIVVTHDYAKKQIRFYRDGAPIGSPFTYTGDVILVSNKTTKIGAYYPYAHRFKGSIDEVRFYNRVLSASEISEHKNGIYRNETALEGAWHFDERLSATVFDSSGNNRHGRISGPEWAYGKSGKALDFGGMDSYYINSGYVDVGNKPSLNISGQITLEAWIKINGTQTYCDWIVSKKDADWSSNGYGLEACPSGNLRLISSGGDNAQSGTWAWDNNWHHVAGTINGNVGRLYLDGVDVTSDSSISSLTTNTGGVKIGKRPSYYFNGIIDEVRVYNRALSASEIQEHKNGTFSNESGLSGLWHFDEGSGEIAYDSSSYGNNSTLVKGAKRVVPSDILNYVSPLEEGKTYKYYVKALGVDTGSGPSNEVSFTTPSCLPAKPNLTVTQKCPAGTSQLHLDWGDDPNTSYWSVYKRRLGESSFLHLINISPPQSYFADNNVESGISYEYYLTAVGKGLSTPSDIISETAPFCYPAPSKPSLKAPDGSATPACFGYSSRILLTWSQDLTGNTISYNIWRKDITLGEIDFSKIFEGLGATATGYTDIVPEGNSFLYEIEAVGTGADNTVFSDPSNQVTSIECSKLPPNPSNLFLNYWVSTADRIAVSLYWTDAGNEKGYKVFRASSPWIQVADLPAEEDPNKNIYWIDYNVVDGQTYEYKIIAYNDNGQTESNSIIVSLPIASPGSFTLSASWQENKIYLSWTESATTPRGGTVTYRVLRDTTSAFASPTIICEGIAVPRECYDNNPSSLESYYKAVATNLGESTDSNVVKKIRMLWKEVIPR